MNSHTEILYAVLAVVVIVVIVLVVRHNSEKKDGEKKKNTFSGAPPPTPQEMCNTFYATPHDKQVCLEAVAACKPFMGPGPLKNRTQVVQQHGKACLNAVTALDPQATADAIVRVLGASGASGANSTCVEASDKAAVKLLPQYMDELSEGLTWGGKVFGAMPTCPPAPSSGKQLNTVGTTGPTAMTRKQQIVSSKF